jgi:hypothetical protein
MPYRFGPGTYGRTDPGESFIRLQAPFVAAGFTTTTQWWGPAHFYPLQIGAEAGGYPRLFLETSAVPLFIGRLKAHYSIGREETSGFLALETGRRSRLIPAFVATLTPAWLPGLEIGATRVFHVRWHREELTLGTAMLPFKGIFKASDATGETFARDLNQTATVFARVAPPGAGVEIYGEFYREDHSVNTRDFIGEPDHASAYTVGMRRAWRQGRGVNAWTFEVANARISHLVRVRIQGPMYIHTAVREGHTHRGQALGSSSVPGGGAMSFGLESLKATSSWFVIGDVERTVIPTDYATTGRQSGYYGVRAGRTYGEPNRALSIQIGLQQGFGLERGRNLQAVISDTRLSW